MTDVIDFYITMKFSAVFSSKTESHTDLIDVIREYRQDLEKFDEIEYARLVNLHVNGKCPNDLKEYLKEVNK